MHRRRKLSAGVMVEVEQVAPTTGIGYLPRDDGDVVMGEAPPKTNEAHEAGQRNQRGEQRHDQQEDDAALRARQGRLWKQ